MDTGDEQSSSSLMDDPGASLDEPFYEPSDSEMETDSEADSEIQSVHSNDSRPVEGLDPDYLTVLYGYTSDHSNSAGEQSDSD